MKPSYYGRMLLSLQCTERLHVCEFVKFLETIYQKFKNIERTNATLRIMTQVAKPRKAINNSRNSFVATFPVACCPVCNAVDHIIFDCPLSPQDRLRKQKGWLYVKTALKVDITYDIVMPIAVAFVEVSTTNWYNLSQGLRHLAPSLLIQLASDTHSNGLQKVAQESSPGQSSSLVAQNLGTDFVLLATAVINIQNKSGSWLPCRALLDFGSQLYIITSRLAHTLQLTKYKSVATVSELVFQFVAFIC